MQIAEEQRCSDCGGSVVEADSEVVCTSCGTVVQRMFETGPESHVYTREDSAKKMRTGPPVSLMLHDGGLSTIVGRPKNSRKLQSDEWRDLLNLQRWQRRVRVSDASERNLSLALSEMSKLSAVLSLPRNVLETASVIYRRAIRERLVRGRSIQNVSAAAIYMSCRKCGVLRTLDEIAVVSTLNKKDLGRSYRLMARQLEMFVPPVTNRSYAARFSNKLVISGKAECIAIKILEFASEHRLSSGKSPAGIAAASTYIATILSNERRTQKEIAETANVTEVSIRNNCRALFEKLVIEIPL